MHKLVQAKDFNHPNFFSTDFFLNKTSVVKITRITCTSEFCKYFQFHGFLFLLYLKTSSLREHKKMLNVGGVNGLSSQPVAQLRYISVARRNSMFKNITHSTVSAFHMWRDKEPTVDALRNSRLSNCYCTESLHTAQSNLLNQKSTHILLKRLYISHYFLLQWIHFESGSKF